MRAFLSPVYLALVLAVGLLIVTFVLSLLILAYRIYLDRAERYRDKRRKEWQPLLFRVLGGEIESAALITRVTRKDFDIFSAMLVDILESVTGEDLARVRVLLAEMGWTEYYRGQLASKDRWERIYAAYMLGLVREADTAPQLTNLLKDEDDQVALSAAQALSLIGRRDLLRDLLVATADRGEWSEELICQVLLDLGPAAATDFQQTLSDPHLTPRERFILVRLLGSLRHLPAASDFIQFLNTTEDPEFRGRLITSLGQMSSIESVVTLEAYLADHDHAETRAAAAAALGQIGDPRAGDRLARSLCDPDWNVRYNAAWSLMALGDAGVSAIRATATEEREGHDVEIARQVLTEHELQA